MSSALEMVIGTPFQKGSIFDDEMVRIMCKGEEMEGVNWMQLLVMWMLGLRDWLACKVNSLHLRNPEKTTVADASNLSWPSKDEWVVASRMCLSTLHVLGNFGFLSFFPMYCLMPLITLCSSTDPHAEKGMSALT